MYVCTDRAHVYCIKSITNGRSHTFDPAIPTHQGFSRTYMASKSNISYAERARRHDNAVVKKLFDIAERKKSNVVLSADLTTTRELLELADSRCCVVKKSIALAVFFFFFFSFQLFKSGFNYSLLSFEPNTDICQNRAGTNKALLGLLSRSRPIYCSIQDTH